MAVASVYELPVPTEFSTFFVSSEAALSVHSALSNAPARKTYYLSKWMPFFEGGEYLIRCVAEDASLWLSTQESNNSRSIHFTKRDSGPQETTIFLPRGRQRFDIILTNVSSVVNAASRCFLAFSIWKAGKLIYTSSAAGWVFDQTKIADADVPALGDWRLDLPVFTVLPNWANPVIERVAYSTEILPSEADIEQRRALRAQPRRSFEAAFARHDATRSRLDNFIVGLGKNLCLVPLWHEQYPLQGTLGSTLTFPTKTIEKREFRSGGLCLVMGKNPSNYEVLIVNEINFDTDTISFVTPPVKTWGVGDRITPLLLARILDNPSMDHPTDRVGLVSLRFTIDDSEPARFVPSWGYCSPVFRFRVDRGSDITIGYDRSTAFVDADEIGPVDVYDPEQRERVSLRAGMQLRGRDEVVAFRKFIDMARGRAIRFWMPTFIADMQAVADINSNHIDVRGAGFFDYLRSQQDFRNWITIEFSDGRPPIYREIAGFAKLTDTIDRVSLKLDVALAEISAISRISFMLPVRFDQDGFEIQHLVDDCAAALTTIAVRTADLYEMEPIECGTTSLTYPLESIDAVDIGFVVLGAQLWKIDREALDIGFVVTSMTNTATVSYATTVMLDEAVDITFVVTDAALVHTVSYGSTTMNDEALDISFVVLSATLIKTVIENDFGPEALDIGFQVSSATLV